jgi:hypothetical protein
MNSSSAPLSTPEGPVSVSGAPNAVNQIEGDVLAPAVLGRAVSLHPLAILLGPDRRRDRRRDPRGAPGPITAVVWTAGHGLGRDRT